MMGLEYQQGQDPDAYARQHGFQSYAQMKAFYQRRSEMTDESTRRPSPTQAPTQPPTRHEPQPRTINGVWDKLMRVLGY